eukprot:7383446-Prymnesium_polylepis.1
MKETATKTELGLGRCAQINDNVNEPTPVPADSPSRACGDPPATGAPALRRHRLPRCPHAAVTFGSDALADRTAVSVHISVEVQRATMRRATVAASLPQARPGPSGWHCAPRAVSSTAARSQAPTPRVRGNGRPTRRQVSGSAVRAARSGL